MIFKFEFHGVPVAEYSMPQFVQAGLDPLWLRRVAGKEVLRRPRLIDLLCSPRSLNHTSSISKEDHP